MPTNHLDASQFTQDQQFDTDIVIIGSGAGGGIAAEQLAQAGFKVMLLEEGAYYTRDDFVMQERWAYPNLYQEGAARKTRDQTIGILQGRTVGGSTTVNWTTSIRTPQPTLDYWHSEFGLDFSADNDLTPYFAKAEQRLNIHQWPIPPNANNAKLQQGCEKLGWQYTVINRNVNGCANLGYCGMGCPINAKQSMLVSTIPAAMALGATLISRISVRQLHWQGDSISSLTAVPVDQHFQPRSAVFVSIDLRAQYTVGHVVGHFAEMQVAREAKCQFVFHDRARQGEGELLHVLVTDDHPATSLPFPGRIPGRDKDRPGDGIAALSGRLRAAEYFDLLEIPGRLRPRYELVKADRAAIDLQLGYPAAGWHAEVLVRLRETDGSLVMPGVFLPAAERFHLASRIDRWVLRHAVDQVPPLKLLTVLLQGIHKGVKGDFVALVQRFQVGKPWAQNTEGAVLLACIVPSHGGMPQGHGWHLFELVPHQPLGVRIVQRQHLQGLGFQGKRHVLKLCAALLEFEP